MVCVVSNKQGIIGWGLAGGHHVGPAVSMCCGAHHSFSSPPSAAAQWIDFDRPVFRSVAIC
jgi:hypothetical protein